MLSDGSGHKVSVECFESGVVVRRVKVAIFIKVGENVVVEFRGKRMLHETGAIFLGDIGKGGVVRAVGRGEELGTEEGEVVKDREDKGFLVEVVNGGVDVTAGNDAKGLILNLLETVDGGGRDVREPYGCCIVND